MSTGPTAAGQGHPRSTPAFTGALLVVLGVLAAAGPLSIDIYTPSLPTIQAELNSPEWLAQASISACLLGIGVGQLLWGPLSDRVGRRPVILAGVAGWTVASILSAVAINAPMLVGARGLAGLFGAAGIVASRSVVRDLSSDTRTLASRIGVLSLVTGLAPVLAPAIGAAIAHLLGWRADFGALAVLGAALVAAVLRYVPETSPVVSRGDDAGGRSPGTLASAVRHRELLAIALVLGTQSFGFYAYITTASFIVERELGYPPFVFALVFCTNAMAMLCANLWFRRLVRRIHPSLPLGLGITVSAAGGLVLFLAATLSAPLWVLWLASTAIGGSAGFVLPGAHSWGQVTPVASGAASALTGSMQFFGGVLGSPVTGLIGPTAANLGAVVALSSGIGLLAWTWARRQITASDPAGLPTEPPAEPPAEPSAGPPAEQRDAPLT